MSDLVTLFHTSEGRIRIRSPFWMKDDIKRPGARWNPEVRVWTISEFLEEELLGVLESLGAEVSHTYPGGGSPRSSTGSASDTWAETLFATLPERFDQSVLRSLAKNLHPDIGGDHRLTQELIAAFEQRRGVA